MSYLRDAMKRPTTIIPDDVYAKPSDDLGRTRASRDAYEQAIPDTRESYIQLTRSMLVRLNIPRSNGDVTPVLCVSHDVKHSGLKMRLPCRLNLTPGALLDVELFTLFRDTPVAAKAVVEKVVRAAGGDIVRYVVEVKFKTLTPAAEHEINAFIHAAQLDERRILLA